MENDQNNSNYKKGIAEGDLAVLYIVFSEEEQMIFKSMFESNALGKHKPKSSKESIERFTTSSLLVVSQDGKITITDKGKNFYSHLVEKFGPF